MSQATFWPEPGQYAACYAALQVESYPDSNKIKSRSFGKTTNSSIPV